MRLDDAPVVGRLCREAVALTTSLSETCAVQREGGPFLVPRASAAEVSAALMRMLAAMADVPVGRATALDTRLRWHICVAPPPGRAARSHAGMLDAVATALVESPQLAEVLMFSSSGYQRELALRAMPAPQTWLGVAGMLLRLNDWVPAVRTAARQALCRVGPLANAALLATTLCEVLPLTIEWERWDAEAQAAMLALTLRPEVARDLMQRLRAAPVGPVPLTVRLLLRAPWLHGWLDAFSATAQQPVVRALATQALMEGEVGVPRYRWRRWPHVDCPARDFPPLWDRVPLANGEAVAEPAVAQRGLMDRCPLVRMTTLQTLERNQQRFGNVAAWVVPLANDRSPRVRARAQYWVTRDA